MLTRWRDLTGDSFSDGLRFDAKLALKFFEIDNLRNEYNAYITNKEREEQEKNNGLSE